MPHSSNPLLAGFTDPSTGVPRISAQSAAFQAAYVHRPHTIPAPAPPPVAPVVTVPVPAPASLPYPPEPIIPVVAAPVQAAPAIAVPDPLPYPSEPTPPTRFTRGEGTGWEKSFCGGFFLPSRKQRKHIDLNYSFIVDLFQPDINLIMFLEYF